MIFLAPFFGIRARCLAHATRKEVTVVNLYPNLYALLESDSNARRLFERAPSQVRRQVLARQQSIRSVAALDAAIAACTP